MTPARSLAASVVALGFASTLTAPDPAFAAPAPCEQAENYAAQSGAELLRIDRLEVRTPRPTTKPDRRDRDEEKADRPVAGAAARVLGADDPGAPDPDDSDTISEGIGMLGQAVLGRLGLEAKPADGAPRLARAGSEPVGGGSPEVGGRGAGELDLAGGGTAGKRAGGTGVDEATGTGGEPGTRNAAAGAAGEKRGKTGEEQDETGDKLGGTGDKLGETSGSQRKTGGSQTKTGDAQGETGDELSETGDQQGETGDQQGEAGDNGPRSDTAGSKDSERAEAGQDQAKSTGGFGIGETRTAMIGNSAVNSAAFARVLDARSDSQLAKPLLQQAPPTHAKGAERTTKPGTAGPLRVGAGELGAHARWDAGMACGRTVGEVTRADASVRGVNALGALMRVPEKGSSLSTTALERHGDETRTVAEATVRAGRIELAGGKVKVRMLKPPTLTASMSATAGGKVDYVPAVIEVSGAGVSKRLSVAGEHVDVPLGAGRHATESALLGGLNGLRPGSPMPIPSIPGLPQVTVPGAGATPQTESGPAAGKVRVSLGQVRQATKGHAIAAKATAIHVSLVQPAAGQGRGKPGYGGKPAPAVTLEAGFGLLEAAAVSPEKAAGGESASGAGGGLPVTGPQLGRLAMAGGALLLAGTAAVVVGLRRRRTH